VAGPDSVTQTLLDGGKLRSGFRQARLTKEAALDNYRATVSDTLLSVRVAYEDALLASRQIVTQEAAVALLTEELNDTRRRFDAGTVPQFNVLRATVSLANQKPALIKARNDFRIAKNNLATLLGWALPHDAGPDIPLEFADKLEVRHLDVALPSAIAKAFQQRPELRVSKTNERLRHEDVIQAKSGYYPTLSAGGGYGWASKVFGPTLGQPPSLADEIHGWNVGLTANWSIWDFGLTDGKVKVAQAGVEKARIESDDLFRRIEQEVRTAHSTLQEATETLESQAKVIEQAQEALRLARARADAGTGTQLDVLDAQTSLTQSRITYDQVLHDVTVACARLERAMGEGVVLGQDKP
jgi:outer membrane protein